jgi:hypothetical protein
MEVNFLAKYANPTLVGMLYERVGDRVYEILGENYFLILYPVLLFFIIAEKYLNIISFDGLVYFTLLLLRRKLVYLDFHFKKISIIFWTITLLLSGLSFSFFKQANYLYMTKAYVECNVLETKEYSLVRRNKGYTTFMMKNQNDIGEDFKVIEDIIGKIDSYEVNQENSYLIRLQNKKEKIVRFNNYNQFTLFSLDVD